MVGILFSFLSSALIRPSISSFKLLPTLFPLSLQIIGFYSSQVIQIFLLLSHLYFLYSFLDSTGTLNKPIYSLDARIHFWAHKCTCECKYDCAVICGNCLFLFTLWVPGINLSQSWWQVFVLSQVFYYLVNLQELRHIFEFQCFMPGILLVLNGVPVSTEFYLSSSKPI